MIATVDMFPVEHCAYEKAQKVYLKEHCTNTFWKDFHCHLHHGIVGCTQDTFVMAQLFEDPDGLRLHVSLFAGELIKAVDILIGLVPNPDQVQWISFERNNVYRRYKRERLLKCLIKLSSTLPFGWGD